MSRLARRVLVLATLVVAGSLLPMPTALGEPAVRLERVPAAPLAVVPLSRPSSHLGLRWTGDHDDRIELRWRAGGGRWSSWERIEPNEDLGDEEQGIVLSALVLADDARAAQVRVTGGAPAAFEVVAIDTRHGPRPVVSRGRSSAAAVNPAPRVPQPRVIRRSEWGADESMRHGELEFAPITRMAVHHTATPNNDPNPAATLRAIYAYHVNVNGWQDVGYNFLIDAQGRVYEGRYARSYAPGEAPTGENTAGHGVVGAHVAGNNTGTVGVALLGDFRATGPSPAATDSLRRLLAWEADRHEIDPLGTTTWTTGQRSTIIGHRDARATECPGDELYAQLPAIRQSVAEMVAGARRGTVVTGYWVLGRDTSLYPFGDATHAPAGGPAPMAPAMSVAPTPTGRGYWVMSSNGRITAYGDAGFHGSTEGMRLNAPAVRLEPTRTGRGYWVLAGDGGVFTFGDAQFFGSTGAMRLNSPVISMTAAPNGRGYWLLAGDGGVFTFGDVAFHGSTGNMRLNAPVVSMASHPSGNGYWLQATDGGIFSFGAVQFHGSVPGLQLRGTANTAQIRATPTGNGYYVLGVDGGIFTFGDSRFFGARPGLGGATAAVDLALRTAA